MASRFDRPPLAALYVLYQGEASSGPTIRYEATCSPWVVRQVVSG